MLEKHHWPEDNSRVSDLLLKTECSRCMELWEDEVEIL